MQNTADWQPSKFVFRGGRLRASKDKRELGAGSRLIADLVAEAYERAIKDHARGRLLDLGCGKVPLYEAYRSRVSAIECVDWAEGLHGQNHLDKICDLTAAIPYPDGSFDTIILSDVLEHLPEPMTCWREISRLLAPGGKLLLNVPFYYQVHEAPHDFYRYTEFALRRFAEGSGLQVEELSAIGGAAEVIADIVGKLLASAGLGGAAIAIQSLTRSVGRTRIGAKLSQRTAQRFPFGYFVVATNKSS